MPEQILFTEQSNGSAAVTSGTNKWTGYDSATTQSLESNIQKIVGGLVPQLNIALYWVGYYNIADTGPISAVCSGSFQAANNALTATIKAGLTDLPYTWINTASKLNKNGADLQTFYVSDVFGIAGWPHPNSSAGVPAIASLNNIY